MFRYRKFKAVTAGLVLAAMFMQSFAAWAITGTAPVAAAESELVKFTPAAVSVDTSTLPPKLADEANKAVWRLFDRDTASIYTPTQTTRLTVTLAEAKTISRLRVFGAPSFQLNVYRDNGGSWESVPSLSGLTLETLNKTSWNTLPAAAPFAAANLLLEFIPLGNVAAGIAELEIWGVDTASTVDASRTTLEGIRTPQEAAGILARKAPHIFEVPAAPSEITLPDGSAGEGFAAVSFTLSQQPSLFKRAYLLYEGNNIATPTAVQRSINNLTWSGGFAIPQPEGKTPAWAPLIEEINPAWLLQGENSIRFRSPNGQAYIRNLRLIIETDSGWNSVASVSSPAFYDGDLSTSYEIHAAANPALQITFERAVEPEKIRLHLHAPAHLKAGLQYSTGNGWQEVKPGWQLDLSTLQPGWNEINVPVQVTATALRLVFDTGSLRLKTGVLTGAINEIRVAASPAGSLSAMPRIVVSYPRNGEFFGRTAYLQGFATPSTNVASAAEVNIEGKIAANQDGAFSIPLTKDETGFSAQPDDEAWSAQVKSEYAGQPGAALTVALTQSSGTASAVDPKKESRGDAPFADNRDKYSEKVAPGQAKKIKYKGVTLDIPEGAVDQETEITIVPLTEADLARLNPGMINVTYPAAGYRFLPHGMKFKKPIKISFGYSKQLFAAGQTDNDVTMYYYNEQLLRWEALVRAKVDSAVSETVSESDHFTDIINSTLVVPEHPQALSFNPNSIKDIKAADPSANVNLIEPPKAGPSGTANLYYPIEIPQGRGAYTPNLKVVYSSSNSNGWMGLGWDIPVSKIQVDTRWGVPIYDPAKETESYLLDGASLAPHVSRPFAATVARSTGDKAFHKRVEGDFQRIIRKNTSPNENDPGAVYYWEVTDKTGVRYIYGQTGQARLSSYVEGKKDIFQWNLEKVIDANGNLTEFFYETDNGNNGEPFKQIYLSRIIYTSHIGATGSKDTTKAVYSVEFNRSVGRPDVNIDGKSGFQMLTRDRLNSVDVKYNGYSIRQYLFSYIPDAEANEFHFGKSLLMRVTHKGQGGTTAKDFYSHDFSYERMPKGSTGSNSYAGFKPQIKQWGDASGGQRLSETEDRSKSISLSVGVGPNTGNWPIFGLQGNYGQGTSSTKGIFLDVNGDGLPDRFKSGGGVELNQLNPAASGRESGVFVAASQPGISKLGYSRNDNFSIGGQIGYWIAAANAAYSYNFVNAEKMMADIDGDGLVDQVDVSGGGLTVLKNDGTKFSPLPWSGYSLIGVDFGNDAAAAKLKGDFFLSDPVRKWIAPFKGVVQVMGAVQKVRAGGKDDVVDPANPAGAKESVRAFIYKNGDASPLWTTEIQAVDVTSHDHDFSITVNSGDRLYFRTTSVDDTEADAVSWQPEIAYQQVCLAADGIESCTTMTSGQSLLKDPLGHSLLAFEAGKDLRLAGNPNNIWKAGTKGQVTITGRVVKKKTTDDVRFAIKLNNATTLWSGSSLAGEEGVFSHELIGQELNQGDQLTFEVTADTTVDPDMVKWQPEINYKNYCFEKPNSNPKEFTCGAVICSPDDSGKVQCTIDSGTLPPETVIEEKDIHQYGQVNYPIYYLTPTDPSRFWIAPYDGKVRIQGNIVRTGQAEAFLAVARGGGRLLWKQQIPAAVQQSDPPSAALYPHDFTVTVAKGDQLFFDVQSRGLIEADKLAWVPSITYSEFCTLDASTGQQVCKPVTATADQNGTTYEYCDTYSDRKECHAISCPVNFVPDSGACRSCTTTTYNNGPNRPQTSCLPITCTDNLIEGKSCSPASIAYTARPANLRHEDTRFTDSGRPDAEAFAGGYRNWFYGDWNGNLGWDESKIKLTRPGDVPAEDNFKGDEYKKQPSYSFINLVPKWQGLAEYQNPAWIGRGENEYIGFDQIRSSRLGTNVGAVIAGTGIGTLQQSASHNFSAGASMIASLSYTFGDSTGKLDFMDMNGDRFPDQVSSGSVLFNSGAGGFAKSLPFSVGNIREIGNKNVSYQLGYTWSQNHQNAKGVTVKLMSVGASLGLAYGVSNTDSDLIDINGDGLPDRVQRVGSNVFEVSLNLGYRFSNPVIWQTGSWGEGDIGTIKDPLVPSDADALQLNENVTYSGAASFFGIGGGASYTVARAMVALRDINGDGLPDQILKIGRDFHVKLNLGDHFGSMQIWQAPEWNRDVADGVITENIPGNNDAINYTSTDSYQLSAGVPIMIPIIPPFIVIWIDITPSISISGGTGGSVLDFQDINGDGLPDHLLKLKGDSAVYVRMNNTGETNLLKEVRRPLGGKFTLAYQRLGNTVAMPHSQWVMKEVGLSDGMGRTYTTGYKYFDGYYSRDEREFYGFARVEETHAPGTPIARSVTQSFLNRDYYLKNLLEQSVTGDWHGNVWAKTANTYVVADVAAGSRFPQLQRSDTFYYDGTTNENSPRKSSYQTYTYDSYGDVTSFYDAGELSTAADDVTATITYWNDPQQYIRKSGTIIVRDAGSNIMRNRWASYENGTGNLRSQTSLTRGNQNPTWQMSYDPYGNIRTISDPVGYTLTYDYDADTATYVTGISDSFSAKDGGPYWSQAGYDLKFGKPAWSRDLNGNYETNNYDEFGRLSNVFGPYDTDASGRAFGTTTLAFAYKPAVISADGENLTSPAGAVTRNKAVSGVGSNGNTLDTVIFADGMKRVLQTKKEADVEGTYGMVASGLVTYDELGRTVEQGQPLFQGGGDLYGYLRQTATRNPTRMAYDPLDRTVRIETPDSQAGGGYAVTTTAYGFGRMNNSGALFATTKVVDPIGVAASEANRKGTKVSFKDVDDRIAAVVEYNHGAPITTSYAYDPLGQITQVKDDRGNLTSVEYDMVGRRTAITNPDTGRTEYDYDANGNLTGKLTANYQNGKPIRYDYTFNRLTRINYPNSTDVLYEYGPMNGAYNRAGRITKVSDESGSEERFYGKLGETTREVKMVAAKTPSAQRKIYTTDYIFDSFGRMLQMTYPDGENLHYAYDNGGLLNAAWGEKRGNRYNYINSLSYDEFGQRKQIAHGNGVRSSYSYDDKTRRLDSLVTSTPEGTIVQNIAYGYDLVGNILKTQNAISTPTNTALPAGPVIQLFDYDDLYQLKNADGEYSFGPGKQNRYRNEFTYDTIGNFTRKSQLHRIIQPSASEHLPKETNYLLDYKYTGTHPHAVTDAGDKLYGYDNNGNMTGWDNKKNGQRRTIIWNEENRVKEIQDNGRSSYYLYDDQGERVSKRGQHGETFYINRFYSIRNGELGTKSIYAGNTRIVSKLVKTPNTATANTATTSTTTTVPGIQGLANGQGKKLGIIRRLDNGSNGTTILPPEEKDQFFYHGDHLGSSNMITDAKGSVYQHLEYFPYGETWIEEGGSYGGNTPGYKFTGKELDPETGLYYFGARYYEPVISKWISADPILGKYLPSGGAEQDENLPGMGGVYNPMNMGLYGYGHHNPVKYVDPNGEFAMQAAGAIVGATVGLGFQAGLDIYHGKLSSSAEYAGAVVGGAAGGVAATLCGPACAGAAAGAASNATTQGINALNGGDISAGSFAADTAIGAVGGKVAGAVVPAAFKALVSKSTKGNIGEGLSALGLKATGQKVVASPAGNGVGKSTFDFKTSNGKFVESKFGTSKLSKPQRAAQKQQGDNLKVHQWNYPTVSGMGAAGAAGTAGKNE